MKSTSMANPFELAAAAGPITEGAWDALLSECGLPPNIQPTRDLRLVEGGKIAGVSESGTSPVQVSRLPHERMATATWDDIANVLRTAEDGSGRTVDVELRPGGELVVTDRQEPTQLLSRLPKGRMAWLAV
jgi:hypothetical protein